MSNKDTALQTLEELSEILCEACFYHDDEFIEGRYYIMKLKKVFEKWNE